MVRQERKVYDQRYKEKHLNEITKRYKQYYIEHKDVINNRAKKHYNKNKHVYILKESITYDPEETKEYNQQYYQKNKERIIKMTRDYDKNNPNNLKKRIKKYKRKIRNRKFIESLD
jgi:hypothetical protein